MGVNRSDVGQVEIKVQAGTGRERWIDMTEGHHVGRKKGAGAVAVAVGVCVWEGEGEIGE